MTIESIENVELMPHNFLTRKVKNENNINFLTG